VARGVVAVRGGHAVVQEVHEPLDAARVAQALGQVAQVLGQDAAARAELAQVVDDGLGPQERGAADVERVAERPERRDARRGEVPSSARVRLTPGAARAGPTAPA
jgi:hypothetical protein